MRGARIRNRPVRDGPVIFGYAGKIRKEIKVNAQSFRERRFEFVFRAIVRTGTRASGCAPAVDPFFAMKEPEQGTRASLSRCDSSPAPKARAARGRCRSA